MTDRNIEKAENMDEAAYTLNKGPRIGSRHVQAVLMFLLLTIGYSFRVNLSVGIVAMTDNTTSPNPDVPTYDWSAKTKNIVLSSFFMGYVTIQIFAGELGKRYGPKWFLVIAMLVNAGGSFATPVFAHLFGWKGLLAVRVSQGIFQGFFFPSVHTILGRWAPKEERSTLANFIFTGVAFGTIFTMPITGMLAATWAGWPIAFYTFGGAGLFWCVIWSILGANSPQECRFISDEEKLYIQTSLDDTEERAPPPTPWKSIFTSLPVWAIVVANSGQNWGYSALLTETPNYLNKVAGITLSKGSFMSAAPYLALFILGLLFGPITDWIITRKILSPTNARKLMNSIGAFSPALALIILGYMPAENIAAIETLLIIAVGVNAAIWCGFQVNPVDLSPKFSGILMGLSNGSSNIFSIISPLIVGAIVTDEKDPTQWRTVFLIAAAIYIASDLFYVVFAQAERQFWDYIDDEPNDVSSTSTAVLGDVNEEKKS